MNNNNADDIPQSERRRVMENDRKVRQGSTYHAHAIASADDLAGGRYAAAESKQTVTGASPISYPRIPSGPWAKNEMPPEPLIDGRGEGNILGYEIDRPDAGSTVAAVEGTPTPASSESHSDVGVGRVARKGLRRI